jgi:hypothetical protein
MKICFYTEGHLGDFILTIPFLNLLIEKYTDNEYYQYIHGSDGTIYPDIFFKTVPNLIPTEKIEGDLVIPTWFCNPIYIPLHMNTEEVIKNLYPYDMVSIQKYFWKHIYSHYNFDITIPNDIGLDFDFSTILNKKSFNLIDKLKNDLRKKILFVNVKGRSGQTDNEDWIPRIIDLASLHPEWDFYYTNSESYEISLTNVIHTPTIFGEHKSDIIHNSYLSIFCDIIVAKNSGAFQAISMQNKNVMNDKKILICQTQDNIHVSDLECFYNRTLYEATNIHTRTTSETFLKLKKILEL